MMDDVIFMISKTLMVNNIYVVRLLTIENQPIAAVDTKYENGYLDSESTSVMLCHRNSRYCN